MVGQHRLDRCTLFSASKEAMRKEVPSNDPAYAEANSWKRVDNQHNRRKEESGERKRRRAGGEDG